MGSVSQSPQLPSRRVLHHLPAAPRLAGLTLQHLAWTSDAAPELFVLLLNMLLHRGQQHLNNPVHSAANFKINHKLSEDTAQARALSPESAAEAARRLQSTHEVTKQCITNVRRYSSESRTEVVRVIAKSSRVLTELPSAQAHRGDCQVMPRVLGRPLA